MNRRRYGTLATVLMIGLLVVAFAAIGCGGSTNNTASPAASASAAGGADQAYAQEQLNGLDALPTFEAPGPAFDAKAVMAGKSIHEHPRHGQRPVLRADEQGHAVRRRRGRLPVLRVEQPGTADPVSAGLRQRHHQEGLADRPARRPGPQRPEAADRRGEGRRDPGRLVSPLGPRADGAERRQQPAHRLQEGRPAAGRLGHHQRHQGARAGGRLRRDRLDGRDA